VYVDVCVCDNEIVGEFVGVNVRVIEVEGVEVSDEVVLGE
jgi:hypothetical protein